MMVRNKICAILNLTEDDSQLRPLTNNRPIASLPFAARYRLIDFALSNIAHAHIDSVALFIAKSGRSVYDHIRAGAPWYLDSPISGGIFTYSQQEYKRHLIDELEEVAEDFYYNSRVFLKQSKAEYVFVAGSNLVSNLDIKELGNFFQSQDSDILLLCKTLQEGDLMGDSELQSLVLDEDKKVKDLVMNSQSDQEVEGDRPVSLDKYFLPVQLMLELIDRAQEDKLYLDLNKLIQHYLLDYQVQAYEHTGYIAKIETIEDYYRVNMSLLDYDLYTEIFHSDLPVLTKTKNGTPTYYGIKSEVKESIIATGTHIYGQVNRSIINRKVEIEAGALVEDSIILQGTKIGAGAEVRYAILDKNCVVEPGAKIIGQPDDLIVVGKEERLKVEQE